MANTLLLSALFLLNCSFISCSDTYYTKWPFSKCSRNDPKLDDCLLKAAKLTLPLLSSENSKYLGMEPLDPLEMGDIETGVHAGPISLDFVCNNTFMEGSLDMELYSVTFDQDNWIIEIEGLHRKLEVTGDYSLAGKLLLFPINSHGSIRTIFRNLKSSHRIQLIPRPFKGITYVDIEVTSNIDSLGHMKIFVTNSLANKTGHALNDILNEHWELIFKGFKHFFETSTADAFSDAFRPFFERFSLDELLPEKL